MPLLLVIAIDQAVLDRAEHDSGDWRVLVALKRLSGSWLIPMRTTSAVVPVSAL